MDQATTAVFAGTSTKKRGGGLYARFTVEYMRYHGTQVLAGHFVTRRIRRDFIDYHRKGVTPDYMIGKVGG